MKARKKYRCVPDRLARAFPWGALATSLFLVMVAVRIPVASLRAADQKVGASLTGQTQADADRKSAGCISCHTQTDQPTMHATGTVLLGCVAHRTSETIDWDPKALKCRHSSRATAMLRPHYREGWKL